MGSRSGSRPNRGTFDANAAAAIAAVASRSRADCREGACAILVVVDATAISCTQSSSTCTSGVAARMHSETGTKTGTRAAGVSADAGDAHNPFALERAHGGEERGPRKSNGRVEKRLAPPRRTLGRRESSRWCE